ncbi:MAG TPA: DUF4197 domain-containing protein [Chitinophagaceae bacterium]|nr:DUF4197 domain-containing protein [Chitinophagaceae bacterium]
MKKLLTVLFLISGMAAMAQSGDLFSSIKKKVNGGNGSSSLSSDDIVSGLKQALTLGAQKSADRLSVANGFLNDKAVEILMPEQAQRVEKTLRSLGMGKLVDDAISSMNHAAEDASKSAAPIFVNAIKTMTVKDGLNILKGPDTAATAYLRQSATPDLTRAYSPVIDSALQKTGATKYWKDVFETYNKLPTTFSKVDPDLSSYVTQKAINGIFYYVAQEEILIRKDPAAQVTDLLKKVFGGKS